MEEKIRQEHEYPYVIFIGPRDMTDREMAKYCGHIGFYFREDFEDYCRQFKNEEELLEQFYKIHYSGIYDLVGNNLTDVLTVRAYSQEGQFLTIKYAPTEKKKPSIKVDTSHIKSKDRRREDDDWGRGARSRGR